MLLLLSSAFIFKLPKTIILVKKMDIHMSLNIVWAVSEKKED
jgi:hypothetical protein